jgi:DnaJ-class molecular chaperone
MNDSKGYYKALGIPPGSSIDDVKRAYSKLIHQYHPDHGSEMKKAKHIPDEKQRNARMKEIGEICRKVNEAKAFLSEEKNKQMYDSGIDPESMGQGSTSFFDIMSHLSGRGEKKKVKDTVHKVNITFKESFLGKKLKYKIKRRIVCKTCKGKGGENVKTCDKCQGRGKIQFKTNQMFFVSIQERICENCNGSKYIVKGDPCKECKGKRMLTEEKIIDVDVPRGVKDQEMIVFENQGDEHQEYEPGDLAFLVSVAEDPAFVRVNDDIVARVKVDLYHALVGGEIVFKHLDEKVLQVQINKVTNFEDAIMIRGEGFECKRGHGNLYLKPEYVIPSNIDAEKLKAVLPITIHSQESGEKVVGQYSELPHEEVEQTGPGEGFFSGFSFF